LPTLYLIGGPNGAGKSSFTISHSKFKRLNIFNPDAMILQMKAKGISKKSDQLQWLILEIDNHFKSRESFAYESNLHNEESYGIIAKALVNRYNLELYFISVDDTSKLIERIKKRVSVGLHHVPDKTVLERYNNGLILLPSKISSFKKVHLLDSTNYELSNPIIISKYKKFAMLQNAMPNWCFTVLTDYIDNYQSPYLGR